MKQSNCLKLSFIEEIRYLEENLQNHPIGSSCRASSSRAPVHERLSLPVHEILSLPQSSSIRTLSEDRRHIAQELETSRQVEGSAQSLHINEQPVVSKRGRKPAVPKVTGKRKVVEKPSPKNRVVKSSIQGAATKKRRVTRAQNSPRGKLL
ncbi:hypothetical protein F2Q70_00013779 [Brassica cretica]|uniref:Uncharacterized protein n=1 Tax=Brassica cretica TaxID=69181 RepID=A0A8S9LWS5_BRACR|nr:hypothetical protein F2Q70_00013779 [Brassica cretica]